MKNFGILVLPFAIQILMPVYGQNDKISKTTVHGPQVQDRTKMKSLEKLSRAESKRDIPKIIFLKHLLELECLKENYMKYRNKNFPLKKVRSWTPYENFQKFLILKENPGNPQFSNVERLSGEKKIYFLPSLHGKSKEKDFDKSKWNKEHASNEKEDLNEKVPFTASENNHTQNTTALILKKKDKVNANEYGKDSSTAEISTEHSKVLVVDSDTPTMVSFGSPKTFTKFFLQPIKPTTKTHSQSSKHHLWPFENSHRVRPYEVEETIEENLSVDLHDAKEENLRDLTIDDKKIFGINNFLEGKGKKFAQEKPDNKQNLIGESISSILSDLMNSELKMKTVAEKSKKKLKATPHVVKTKKSLQEAQQFVENRMPGAPTITKRIKILSPSKTAYENQFSRNKYGNRNQRNQEQNFQNVISLSPLSFKISAKEPKNNKKSTAIPETFSIFRKINFHTKEGLRKEAVEAEMGKTQTEMARGKISLDLSFFEDGNKETSTPQKVYTKPFFSSHPLKNSEFLKNWSTPSLPLTTFSEFKRQNDETVTKSSATLNTSIFTMQPDTTIQNKQNKTQKYFYETESVVSKFEKFTKQPGNYDFVANTDKFDFEKSFENDSERKSSRKLNFAKEPTKSMNLNAGEDNSEQRRSDIEIEDNEKNHDTNEEYVSKLNYLEKVKVDASRGYHNSLFNLSFESIIPMIPKIIDDLREKRISPEREATLSEILGKYWPDIKALSNDSNTDMLPLLKMKSREDLEKVLQGSAREQLVLTTSQRPRSFIDRSVDYDLSFDYVEEYKELYEDALTQETDWEKKNFRPKRNEENGWESQEATKGYFENIGLKDDEEGS